MGKHSILLSKFDRSFLGDPNLILPALCAALKHPANRQLSYKTIIAINFSRQPLALLNQSNDGYEVIIAENPTQIPDQTSPRENLVLVLPDRERTNGSRYRRIVNQFLIEQKQQGQRSFSIWGCGHVGRLFAGSLEIPAGMQLMAVVDSNPNLRGKTFCGLPIQAVEHLAAIQCDIVLILIKGHKASIAQQIKKLPGHRFWSPFDSHAIKGEAHYADLDRHLRSRGYALENDYFNLNDPRIFETSRKSLVDIFQQELLNFWRDQTIKLIKPISDMEQKLRDSSWGTMAWYVSELYDKLGFLVQHLHGFHRMQNKGLGKWLEILGWEKWCLAEVNEPIEDKTILDIGFGPSLMNAVLLLFEGARKIIAVDPGSHPDSVEGWFGYSVPLLWYQFGDFVGDSAKQRAESLLPGIFQGFDFANQKIKINSEYIKVCYHGIEDLNRQSDRADIAFSYAVFEHVSDPEMTLHALFQILNPGGYAFLHIDYGMHSDPDIHHFKAYEEGFKPVSTFKNNHGVPLNRHRTPHFIDLFSRVGFELVQYFPGSRVEFTGDDLKCIHSSYKTLPIEYLAEKDATFFIRKPV